MQQYMLERRAVQPDVFLPVNLNRDNLREITPIGSGLAVFIDTQTGQIHDGNEYYNEYLRTL